MIMENSSLIEKIRKLPAEKLDEIEKLVDFWCHQAKEINGSPKLDIRECDLEARGISREDAAAQRAALSTFAEDWELPQMNIYDEL